MDFLEVKIEGLLFSFHDEPCGQLVALAAVAPFPEWGTAGFALAKGKPDVEDVCGESGDSGDERAVDTAVGTGLSGATGSDIAEEGFGLRDQEQERPEDSVSEDSDAEGEYQAAYTALWAALPAVHRHLLEDAYKQPRSWYESGWQDWG